MYCEEAVYIGILHLAQLYAQAIEWCTVLWDGIDRDAFNVRQPARRLFRNAFTGRATTGPARVVTSATLWRRLIRVIF